MNQLCEDCSICGSPLSEKFQTTLSCHHTFHYECLLKTFQMNRQEYNKNSNRCPYCRKNSDYLPIINGLTKCIPCIHYNPHQSGPPEINTIRCQHTLTRGKNKGNLCLKKCQLGYNYCKNHK